MTLAFQTDDAFFLAQGVNMNFGWSLPGAVIAKLVPPVGSDCAALPTLSRFGDLRAVYHAKIGVNIVAGSQLQ